MKRQTNLSAIVVLAIIAALFPSFPHALQAAAQNQAVSADNCVVEIISPRPGDKVGPSRTVKGTAKIPAHGFLWILARKKSMGNQWWPQAGGPVEIDESGQWEAEVFFGRPNDVGSIFEIAAVVVTRQTNEDLIKWFATAKSLDYPPVPFPNSSGCSVVTVKVEKSS